MDCATLGTGYSSSSSSSTLTRLSKWRNPSVISGSVQLVRSQHNRKRNFLFKSFKCVSICRPSLAAVKLRSLASEFTELSEPIDRVKRLLQYAAILPPFDESARVPANRVAGCTAEVWLDVRLDEFGGTRFAVDSDSEITKGFCSCLIWILDGAPPEEVLKMKAEDLMEMNVGVGLGVRGHSRVNTWHSILITMQKRTEALVAERQGKTQPQIEIFSSLVDDMIPNPQTQVF